MSDSLKNQLISLGLAKEPKPGKAGSKSPGTRHPGSKNGGAKNKRAGRQRRPAGAELSLDEAWRLRQSEEKQTAEAKRQQKRAADLLRRQINAKIQAVVDAHARNDEAAELKRNFLYKGRIRSVLVTPEQLQQLNAGELGVVFLRGGYFLMPPEHVEAIRCISPDHVPDLGGDSPEDEEFPVPDDLVW